MPMTMHEARRTLVKSPPELWAECSDGESLSRHLGAFGEIRITKLEPETAVAWEGDDVCGTVTLEPSGWGTRVVLTATADGARPETTGPPPEQELEPEPEPEPEPELEPEAVAAPDAAAEAESHPAAHSAVEPEPELEPDPEPEPGPGPGPEPAGGSEPDDHVDPVSKPEPEPDSEAIRPKFFARLFGFRRRRWPAPAPLGDEDPLIELAGGGEPTVGPPGAPGAKATPEPAVKPLPDPDPAAAAKAEPDPEPDSPPPVELEALVGALDSLGTAHRRPFSRS
jgi:hypothetical protein